MKNLLPIILLILSLTNLKAQGINKNDEEIAIELQGGSNWVETSFNITIKQKASDIFIRYAIKEGFDRPSINKDSIIKALRVKYKDARTDPEVERKLIKDFAAIMKQSVVFHKDSIMLSKDAAIDYKRLLSFIAGADVKKFEGGTYSTMDAGSLTCNIAHGAKMLNIEKSAPLSLISPLLYAFFNETLKIGRKANSKTALKIDEMFNYLF